MARLCWISVFGLALFPAFGQTTLNLSQDLVRLGIASSNMVPNQPTLDSGPLLYQAVEYARGQQVTLVIADPGVYYFLGLQNPKWHVQMFGVNNITIDLQGSNLIFTHPLQTALFLGYSTNAVLQNFTVDYQPLPFTQVRVVSVNPTLAQIQYAVQPGWQDPSIFTSAQPDAAIQVLIFRNGQPAFGTRRMAAQSSIQDNLITIVPENFVPTPQNMSMIRPGDIAAVSMLSGGGTIVTNSCTGCTLRNITVYSGSTAAVNTHFSPSTALERIYMIPKPGTDRLVSAFGINSTNPGPNARIRLNRAVRSMDDGFGLFNWVTGVVQSQDSNQTLTVAGTVTTALGWGVSLPNGSPVVFENPPDGSILASAIVVSQTQPSISAEFNLVTFQFDRNLPSGLVGSYMYTTDPDLRGANSVIERNMVLSSNGSLDVGGWASNSTVHGNYIRRTAYSGIYGKQNLEQNCCDDKTTPLVNVTISNNIVDGANLSPIRSLWMGALGGIQISTLGSDQSGIPKLMTTSPHQNITIANNFIADAGRSAVWVGNTAGGTVTGNYLLNPGDAPDLPDVNPSYSADAVRPLVIDTTSSGITTANNPIDQTSLRVFVTDTQYRELAAYAPSSIIRLNAYDVGTLSSPTVALVDADGTTTPVSIQNTITHAVDVRIPAAVALGGAYLKLTANGTSYFGTLFIDSQDNISAVNGCTYETSLSSSSVAAGASSLPILVVTQTGCSFQVSATDSFVTPGAGATGTAAISVGFSANTGAARTTTIEIAGQPITLTQAAQGAALGVSATHIGSFVQGQPSAVYTLSIQNTGTTATNGAVSVTDSVPAGLTPSAISGPGWACTLATLTCSRSDGLAAGGTYPPITVTVSVASNAASPVTNQVSASGGGSATATASDSTTIVPAFTDIPASDSSFIPFIDLLQQSGITKGCQDSPPMYCSTAPIPESQMAVFVIRSVIGNDNFAYTPTPYFTDVPSSNLYFPWIQKMQDLGIALPCAQTLYCPDSAVTRGIMSVLIIRSRFGVTIPTNYPTTPYFTDVPANHPYFPWIQKMKQLGITSGCTPTTYCPDVPVTRGQMAVFIMRGEFNQGLQDPTTPVLVWANPASASPGQTVTVTIVGQNTNFVGGVTQVDAGAGITVSNISVTNGTTLTAQFSVSLGATLGPRSITIITGSEEATLPNGSHVQ